MKLIHCDMGHMKVATWFFYSTMYACMHVCKYASMKIYNYASMQICKFINLQVSKYAST